jgi:tripeptide aminopeptidase
VVSETKGYGVKPQVVSKYKGGDIALLSGGVISAEEFPVLKNYVGMDIVTSDGTTILGADDKAGVAEIMEMVEYLTKHPEVKHGKIGIAFTPDEEIGNGASRFNVEKFGCDYAYTVDGEQIGEISYETFNGAAFEITITGKNIHPGQAKGKMINAVAVASQLLNAFPASERPETTEGREGYYFFNDMKANVEFAQIAGIIRDHDKAKFEDRKKYLQRVVNIMQTEYPNRVTLTLKDQYYNCAEIIKQHFHLVENAQKAMLSVGVTPIVEPIRGGTDGSGLSFKGLPCPNICTGGHNAHGLHEFVPVQCMEKVVNILLGIVACYAGD